MEIKKPRIVDKIWGNEEIIAEGNPDYCGKKLNLKEGYRCSIHKHAKDETFYIQEGKLYLELEGSSEAFEKAILSKGNIVHIPINKWHRFSGLEDSVIIEFSTPDVESERRTKSEKIPDFVEWKNKILNQNE